MVQVTVPTNGNLSHASGLQIRVLADGSTGGATDALQISATWEYTNPKFADGESMMVKNGRTLVHNEGSALA